MAGLHEGRHEHLMNLEASSVAQFMSHSARDDDRNVMTEYRSEQAYTCNDSTSHSSSAEGLVDLADRHQVSSKVVTDDFSISLLGSYSINGDSFEISSSALIDDPSSVRNNDAETSNSWEHGRNKQDEQETQDGQNTKDEQDTQDEGPSLPSSHHISQDLRGSVEKSISQVHFHKDPRDQRIHQSSHFRPEEFHMGSSFPRQPQTWDISRVVVEVIVIAPKLTELQIGVEGTSNDDSCKADFSLGGGIDSKLRAWNITTQLPLFPGERVMAQYVIWSGGKDRLSSLVENFFIPTNFALETPEKRCRVQLRDPRLHIDVCGEVGQIKKPKEYTLTDWLAVLSVLIARVNEDNVQTILTIYFYQRPDVSTMMTLQTQHSLESLKTVVNWGSAIQKKYGSRSRGESFESLVAKHGIVSVALLELLVAVRTKGRETSRAFLNTLGSMLVFYRGSRPDSPILRNELVRNVLQETIVNLVSCISPFSFEWVQYLNVLAFFDPTLNFVNGWETFRFGEDMDSEIDSARRGYSVAIREFYRSKFLGSSEERLAVVASALRAAPTIHDFFCAANKFRLEEVGWLFSENSNDSAAMHLMEEALHKCFAKIIEQHENRVDRKSNIQRQFEIALNVDHQMVRERYLFLAPSFRDHLVELFEQFLYFEDQSQGTSMALKDSLSLWKPWGKNENELSEVILSLFMSPHAFITPLRPCEMRLLTALSMASSSKVYSQGRTALKLLANRATSYTEFRETLKVWLQGAARRIVGGVGFDPSACLPPYSFLEALGELLDSGIESSLVSSLAQMAISMAVDECPNLHTFLQDSKNITLLQSTVVENHYLDAAGGMMKDVFEAFETRSQLDEEACAILRAVCQETNRNSFQLQNLIGERLCVILLDTVISVKGDLQHELNLRPIETIAEHKFPSLLMQIEKCPPYIKVHMLYEDIHKAFLSLGDSLVSESVCLRYIKLGSTSKDWVKIFHNLDNTSFVAALRKALKELQIYEKRLDGYKVLLNNICLFLIDNNIAVEGHEKWRNWLATRCSEWENFTLGDILSAPDHWPCEHETFFSYLDSVLTLSTSRILLNVLLESVLSRKSDNGGELIRSIPATESRPETRFEIRLSTVASIIIPEAVHQYEVDMRLFAAIDSNLDKIQMGRVCSLWNGILPNAVKTEFELSCKQLGFDSMKMRNLSKYFCNIETNIAVYLQTWSSVSVLRELHSILPRVASVFEMSKDCDGLVLRIREVITECIPECSFQHFQEVLENGGQNVLSIFSMSEVDTLKELTNTGELIAFLRQTVQEDLRHLLDAVEDPNSTRSWEGLINDLIDLQRVFRPILTTTTTSFEDLRAAILRELNSSSSSSNHLRRKLKACNEEAKSLHQYFKGVANRTHKDKDQITNILTNGTYHFSVDEYGCLLELKCDNKGESSKSSGNDNVPDNSLGAVSYNLAQLQELKSRTRWHVSSNTFTKKSKTVESYGADWTGADAESIDTSEKNALLFISHIDVAEQLVEILTELYNCGHFAYASFQTVAPDFASLQILNDQLKCELSTWKAALLRSRKDFRCLNFFRSVEIRFILEALMIQNSVPFGEKLEHCLNLFQWAGTPSVQLTDVKNKAATLGIPNSVSNIVKLRHNAEEQLIYRCLRDCSSVIESIIFEKKPKNLDAVAARSKYRLFNGIILADVDDPQDELNVVVTLFSERNLHLQGSASNVILCEVSTAWEDLYLLLLRYLNNRESEDNFYCIVYVERLSYDCQTQLMAMLEQITQTNPVGDSELALVSCSRSKFLIAISQRLQIQVRHPATAIADAVRIQREGVWMITSDLPGMGKTRFIREVAGKDYPNDCISTLTICGEVSCNQLIRQLNNLFSTVYPRQTSIYLHLDVSVVSNPETLNDLLFELLVLGCLKSDRAGLFHLKTERVAIEVANTYHNYLASELPVCKWFRTKHLVWDMARFQPNMDLESDDQYVCNYLHAMEQGILHRWSPDGKDIGHLSLIESQLGQGLLQRYFVDFLKDKKSISFSLLQTFTKFFAHQLRKFSGCPFFYPENLLYMGGQLSTRSVIVESLLEVSRELSARSVKPWLDEQQEVTMSASAEVLMAARMENMQRWSDSKHVMIFFMASSQPAILYRELSHVPIALVELFQKQRAKLTNYESLSSDQLYEKLWPILHETQLLVRDKHYVLTADNFLKMALIFTKVQAGVPVVIMGETGCGKTSLLRQLADYCCVIFLSITLHAGTTEDEIRSFLSKAERQSQIGLVWVLLDEINACNHLGFLVGVICHHLVDGKPLPSNVKILAACNPYRKHEFKKQRAGLSTRDMLRSRNVEYLDKAYTVHPLPEALVENVQDFGILNVRDEEAYIQAIVLKFTKLKVVTFPFTQLLVMSQAFVRGKSGEASVSLRDVRRCVDLLNYFCEDLEGRPQSPSLSPKCRVKRAALLAFAHCYYYRLASNEERAEYKAKYVKTMYKNKWRKRILRESSLEKRFDKELFEEQMNLLNHMEIQPGVAKNQALRENVFVTLTCILLKIPLFVVGKPGSGKTLSLQLIFSNLRGSGMKDPYFSEKPTMFMFSYQGSESSTSEGILKVFEKAYRCVEDNKKKNVKAVVVVVLDEVGLAEISSSNPLKVLHSLLEPEGEQQVAVIGISNWSLDAAKMNRAIHISQPDPSVTDLVGTAEAILDSYGLRNFFGVDQMTDMKSLAKVYHEYHVRQSKPDFHGLRDFYSLVKSLRGDEKNPKKWTPDCLNQAVWRNFGGSPNDIPLITSILRQYFKPRPPPAVDFKPTPALNLVRANIEDQHARHLMLIGNVESCIGIIETMLKLKEKLMIIQGSKFKNDHNDDYAYLMLSNIILHMEHGRHIVLKGVERVWSSLYDMLNQHYITVGGRQNCRIAIGAFSNPMCYVHENFRCIVVVDQDQVDSLDPPFLNRFEKQVLTWESVLSPEQRENVLLLDKWVKAMACISEGDSEVEEISFCESDLFAGYSTDTLASLVLQKWGTYSMSERTCFLDRCKEELLQTAYIDGMMRAHFSRRCLPDAKTWTKLYFQRIVNQESLEFVVCQRVDHKSLWHDSLGLKLVITTRCNVHTDIRLGLKDPQRFKKMKIIKLADFTAERQLVAAIQSWSKSDSDLLIVQSDTILDKDHLPLAKVHVERTRADLLAQGQRHTGSKHLVFILHTHRGEQKTSSSFSFLSGWEQVTLDLLQQANTDYGQYLDKSIAELVRSESFRESNNLMVKVLTWSFLCIKYPRENQTAKYCLNMVQKICSDKHLCECFIQRALVWLNADAEKDKEMGKFWQTSVVCNPGRLALAFDLHSALVTYVEEKLREPIARLIYVLESHSALGSYFNMNDSRKVLWRRVFMDQQMVRIESVPEPMHPEGYTIKDPVSLSVPFSDLYADHIDKHMQEVYLARVSDRQEEDAVSLALSMTKDVTVSLSTNSTMREIEECIQANPDDYCRDFCLLYAPYQSKIFTVLESLVFEWVLRGKAPDPKPLSLHALLWTKLEKLKTQALLAGSCFTVNEMLYEVELIKRDKNFEDFDNKFATKCISKMLPSKEEVIQRAGGLQRWLYQFESLISLVFNIRSEEPTHVSIMLMLRVVRDFTKFIILPLSVTSDHLCGLSHWFLRCNLRPPLEALVIKIISLLPDLNTLQGLRRDMYFRFAASTFSLLLESNNVSQDVVSTISGVIFHLNAPTCSMKNVMFHFLKAVVQLLIPASTLDCPHFLQLCFVNCSNVIKEQAWESNFSKPFILLSDVIYESVRVFITPELLSGTDTDAFTFQKFLMCLRITISEVTLLSGRLNFRAACSFALLRSIMEVLAQDMVTVQKKEPRIFHPRLAPAASKILTDYFVQSHVNVASMKHYLMKVLFHHCGLSLQMMSQLACECETNEHLKLYSLILGGNMLKDLDNPLGFNPFTSIFSNFEENDVLLWKALQTVGEMQEMLKFQIQNLGPSEQGAFASAVASKIFLVQASRKLSNAELAVIDWLLQEATLEHWDEKWKDAIHFLIKRSPLHLDGDTTTARALQFKALAAHILLVVTSFPSDSPLQGYVTLDEMHTAENFVLAAPDNVFSTLSTTLMATGTYRHNCGYLYVVGECTMPMQSSKCPDCGGIIGGSNHMPAAGNKKFSINVIEKGYIPDDFARTNPFHRIRGLEAKSYRTLRIVVHYCFLLCLYMGRGASRFAAALGVSKSSVLKEFEERIEEDLNGLGVLLNCNHSVTCEFMHTVVASMANNLPDEYLTTPEKRTLWEMKFDDVVKNIFSVNAHREYVEKHRGKNEIVELLEERRVPPFPVATTDFARTIALPDLKNFKAMYLQDEARQKEYPIIQRFFAHISRLSEMKELLGLLPFTKAVNEQLWSKISRPEAASISIGTFLSGLSDKDKHIREDFPDFARAWNEMRFKVKAFECTQFRQGIPDMNLNSSIGFCLVEPRDLGIYLAAILDYLRAIQNGFLDEVMAFVPANQTITEESIHRSLRLQMCKAKEVVFLDEHSLQSIVCRTAMANLQYNQGRNPIYDYHSIAEELHQLVDQKPRLEAWEPFAYKYEAFHKHMTIISDVGNLIPQIVLGSEVLLDIQNEIELSSVGAGQCLAILDICLGFLRRTGGDPVEKLGSYCQRWLGDQAFHLIQMHTLRLVELQHVVSLYEALEDFAGVDIQALVNIRYRTSLSPDLEEELNSSVELKRSWTRPAQSSDAEEPKISAELFLDVLRRFMFRHLIGDQLNPDVPLSIYITDPRLMKWPEDVEDVVDDVFPPSLLVKHSHATYLYLTKMVNARKAT